MVELKPRGASIPVTLANRKEYVDLVAYHKMTSAIRAQIDSFVAGFRELVPPHLTHYFDASELELLICGLPEIDLDDWEENTTYSGGYSRGSSQIEWFWRVVRGASCVVWRGGLNGRAGLDWTGLNWTDARVTLDFCFFRGRVCETTAATDVLSREERAKLLMFVTGTSQVPLGGFKELVGMRFVQFVGCGPVGPFLVALTPPPVASNASRSSKSPPLTART